MSQNDQLVKFFQVEFFKLAVEFEELGTGTVVKEETSATLKDKVVGSNAKL